MEKKIGQLIRERLEASNMEVTAFAKAIDKERSNIYDIFKRDSIDTKLLKKIGQVLNYDFFQELLEDSTIEKLKIDQATRKAKVLVEIEISEDEIMKIGFEEKVFKILNR
jgi:hypothetical protein